MPSRRALARPQRARSNQGRRAPLSPAARHLTAMMAGGVLGAHAAAALAVVVLLLARGPRGAASAAIAAAAVVLFFAIGHAVQLRFADADPRRLLLAALVSYGLRVAALGALLGFALEHPDLPLDADALALGAVVTVLGWVGGEIRAFRRLRVPVFDPVTPPDVTVPASRNRV